MLKKEIMDIVSRFSNGITIIEFLSIIQEKDFTFQEIRKNINLLIVEEKIYMKTNNRLMTNKAMIKNE